MSTLRSAVDYIVSVIDSTVPVEIPGRRFSRILDSMAPHKDRNYIVLPTTVSAVGTPLCKNRLSAMTEINVYVIYTSSTSQSDDHIRMMQDAAQLITGICGTPKSTSAPWHSIVYGDTSITSDEESDLYTVIMAFSMQQGVAP